MRGGCARSAIQARRQGRGGRRAIGGTPGCAPPTLWRGAAGAAAVAPAGDVRGPAMALARRITHTTDARASRSPRGAAPRPRAGARTAGRTPGRVPLDAAGAGALLPPLGRQRQGQGRCAGARDRAPGGRQPALSHVAWRQRSRGRGRVLCKPEVLAFFSAPPRRAKALRRLVDTARDRGRRGRRPAPAALHRVPAVAAGLCGGGRQAWAGRGRRARGRRRRRPPGRRAPSRQATRCVERPSTAYLTPRASSPLVGPAGGGRGARGGAGADTRRRRDVGAGEPARPGRGAGQGAAAARRGAPAGRVGAPSESAPPEREVERRVKALYAGVDASGAVQYEGKFISHAYVPTDKAAAPRRRRRRGGRPPSTWRRPRRWRRPPSRRSGAHGVSAEQRGARARDRRIRASAAARRAPRRGRGASRPRCSAGRPAWRGRRRRRRRQRQRRLRCLINNSCEVYPQPQRAPWSALAPPGGPALVAPARARAVARALGIARRRLRRAPAPRESSRLRARPRRRRRPRAAPRRGRRALRCARASRSARSSLHGPVGRLLARRASARSRSRAARSRAALASSAATSRARRAAPRVRASAASAALRPRRVRDARAARPHRRLLRSWRPGRAPRRLASARSRASASASLARRAAAPRALPPHVGRGRRRPRSGGAKLGGARRPRRRGLARPARAPEHRPRRGKALDVVKDGAAAPRGSRAAAVRAALPAPPPSGPAPRPPPPLPAPARRRLLSPASLSRAAPQR